MGPQRFVDVWFDLDEAAVLDQIARLRRVARAVEDTSKPNRQISIDFENFIFANFQTVGGMTEEGGWEPLAESTQEWKESQGYEMILQNTGSLRDSFKGFYTDRIAGAGAKQVFADKDGNRRDPDIAAVHEFGSPDGVVPSRPMLPNPRQAVAIAIRVYDLWIKEHTR